MISNKTLKSSLKALKDFAKKRLPDQELIELDARDECPVEIVHDMCSPGQAGHSTAVHSRRVRRLRRRHLRFLSRLRGDGAHRSGRRHRRVCHLPRQRPDLRRRHAGAEEALADPHRGRGLAVRLRRHRTGGRQRSGSSARARPSASWKATASSATRSTG